MTKKFPFTRRAVESLPAHDPASPSHEAEYSDASCVGLHLRVSKGGRKFYQMRYRTPHGGRKRCLSLGEHTERFGVQEARLLVAEHKAALGRGVDPAEEREKRREDSTLAEFVQETYLPLARARKKSVRDDEFWLTKHILPALGGRALKSITTGDVTRLHLKERERSSEGGANHLLSILRTVLSTAAKQGFIDRNPASSGSVSKFSEPPPRDRFLSKEELPRFLAALEGAGGRLGVAALRLLTFTGMRAGEATSLRWEQVDLEAGRISLPITKNERPRHVHLNSRALEALRDLAARRDSEELTRGSEYLFPSRAGSRKPFLSDLRAPFHEACRRSGIANVRIHDLRRAFGSWGVISGATIYSVGKLLGHNTTHVTESTYGFLSGGALLDASEGIVTMLGEAEAEAARKRKAEAVPEGGAAHPEPGEQAVG